MYVLETGVDYGGSNIPSNACGQYRTRALLEEACTSKFECIGYSTRTSKASSNHREENRFYPWCLKKTKDKKGNAADHNYYRKIERGNETGNVKK